MNEPLQPSPNRPKQFSLKRLFLQVTVIAVVCAVIGGLYRSPGNAVLVVFVVGGTVYVNLPVLVVFLAAQIPAPHQWLKYTCDAVLICVFVSVVGVAECFGSFSGVCLGMLTLLCWTPQLWIYKRWRATGRW